MNNNERFEMNQDGWIRMDVTQDDNARGKRVTLTIVNILIVVIPFVVWLAGL